MLDKPDKSSLKLRPLVSAVGATFAVTLGSTVNAQDNPFSLTELSNGYRVAQERIPVRNRQRVNAVKVSALLG